MSASTASPLPASTGPAKVLVVEDDAIVTRDVTSILEEMGCEVAGVVREGEEAIRAARKQRLALVLMDIRLAGEMDGIEAAETIQETLDVPVVYLTAYADEETRARVRETAPFGYVLKPFSDSELKTAIEVAFFRRRMEQKLQAERAKLAERVKEQSCLYDVSRILDDEDSELEERLQAVVDRLPAGWQYPDVTVARLQVGDETFRSDGYRQTEWSLRAPVETDDERLGEIEVRYLEERPREDLGAFLTEERLLLDEIAERVADELERKRTKRQLRESELRFRQMAETIEEVFWLRDPAHEEMLYISPAFEQIWGRTVEELYEEPELWLESIHPEDRERVKETALKEQRTEFEEEYRLVRPDGEVRWIRDRGFPVTDDEGTVYRMAGVASDVTEQKQFESQLQHRALHDYLTGLPNRALFRDRLDHALARAERADEDLAVLFVDLKRFKVVNDSLGHDAGDRVLEAIARRLQSAIRSQDTVARVGGDEFTVLLEDVAGEEGADEAADRLVQCFEAPIPLEDREVPIEASIGLVTYGGNGEARTGSSELIQWADAAMYRAKERPGTGYATAEPETTSPRTGRLERETRLREALEAGRIQTVYQPIYSLATGRIEGVEALARWEDPDLGEVSPGAFIPLAEETGLILPLGLQQLDRACRRLLGDGFTSGEGGRPLRLSVNLSARQLEHPEIVQEIREILEATGFPPSRLCLEITESAAMRKPEVVGQMKRIGVDMAIDDFGTRYSTLSQLRRLEVDALKIDRTFVDGLPDDEQDRAIVETILTLGRSLKLSVVAEGIENEQQLEALRDMGCEEAQGFHLARPQPAEELEALLEESARDG